MAFALFFCSPAYDLGELGTEMARLFAGVQVIGCTTAGEIGPVGYREHSISGASFGAGWYAAAVGRLDGLARFDSGRGRSLAQRLVQRLGDSDPVPRGENSFALLLVDGLSAREETVACAVQSGLAEIPLVGGSAGDELRFNRTHVYCDGAFRTDSAAMVVVSTRLRLTTFKSQHFVATDNRFVVTEAVPERRVVAEIDGRPAAEHYAQLIGTTVDCLSPSRFAAHPVVVRIDGAEYVRSIQKANPDRSLTFYCAIEEGLVLRAARAGGLVKALEETLAEVREQIGRPEVIIGCDCILRRLEVIEEGLQDRVENVFRAHNVVGFSSYGEQFRGIHVNQTLTGVALGAPST